MYACILETKRGFLEGLCACCEAAADLHDPPLRLDSRIALFQRCGKSNTGGLHPSVLLLSVSPTNRLMGLG